MKALEAFAEIVKDNEPLAPYTYLKLGGPAEALVQPRSREELAAVVRRCRQLDLPYRVLGAGCNILVREEGVRGVVLRLSHPTFGQVTVEDRLVHAGAGAQLSALVSQAVRHSLGSLESLVGIPGTVGGALRSNAGDRAGEIGPFVQRVEIMDNQGDVQTREREELRFAYRWSNLDDGILLAAVFELEPDGADAIVKRMRKAWIQRKAAQPLSFQASVRAFKDSRGFSAASLIEQAGLGRTRVGGVELSERDANFVVAHPDATPRDVLRLIDMARTRVQERFNIELELQITVW